MESSLSGGSTFLKKLRMLALGFAMVLPAGVFFMLLMFVDGIFDFEFGRGVRGLTELRLAIVGGGRGRAESLGGVGGLPVEGFRGVAVVGDLFSRGFLNMLFLPVVEVAPMMSSSALRYSTEPKTEIGRFVFVD
jgi:hypothetical protein